MAPPLPSRKEREMSNDLRPDLHRLVGDFQDAVRSIEDAWAARDTSEALGAVVVRKRQTVELIP